MRFSDNGMSAILLCSYIGLKQGDALKPLTPKEWNEFLDRIAQYGQQPEVVLRQNQDFLREAGYGQEYAERIKGLTDRGGAVAFELDGLERKGIQVVTPYDQDYPVLLKRKLKKKTPPVLFYCGDITLAKKIGIGVVGSRKVDEAGIRFAEELVRKASEERLVVYSGGAKGVDTISERVAIESGSAAVSFVADSLLSKIRKKDIIDSVINGQRLLISDVKPDVGFTAARAMNRNKYIYASSYGTFVVASDYNTGGTWTGATEAMRNGWTKVLVWSRGTYEGNRKLIEKGAVPYELSEASVYEVITRKEEEEFQQMDLFSFAREEGRRQEEIRPAEGHGVPEVQSGEEESLAEEHGVPAVQSGREESPPEEHGVSVVQNEEQISLTKENTAPTVQSGEGGRAAEVGRTELGREETGQIDLYNVAGPYIAAHIGDGMTRDEAAEVFQVAKKQMETWLKRLCRDSRLECIEGRYVRREG